VHAPVIHGPTLFVYLGSTLPLVCVSSTRDREGAVVLPGVTSPAFRDDRWHGLLARSDDRDGVEGSVSRRRRKMRGALPASSPGGGVGESSFVLMSP